MRAIDADRLKAVLEKNFGHTGGASVLEQLIDEQPTIEPSTNCSEIPNSSDAVSRQAAIDALDKRFDNIPMEQTAEILMLRKDLRELPTIQPEPQWIPVSEKLPETEDFVLASLSGKYRNTTFEHACEIADYADGEWCVYAYPHMSAEKCAELIEAWMPLPEPYKPNEKQSGKEGV